MDPLFDEHGREIHVGDVLKVFHFIGSRRKRHYMYKQAIRYQEHEGGGGYLLVSHLNEPCLTEFKIGENCFLERADGRRLRGWEIVQPARLLDRTKKPAE